MARCLEEISRADALHLLASKSVGRVAITIGALPAILPVNYALMDDTIVFRTAPGTKLTAAVQEAVVAFEVDEADDRATTGWSVLVVGHAAEIRDGETLARAHALELTPWAPDTRDHFVQISTELVTGRRIRATPGDGHSD